MDYCCFHEDIEYIRILSILIYVINIYDICTLRFEVGSVNRQGPYPRQTRFSYHILNRTETNTISCRRARMSVARHVVLVPVQWNCHSLFLHCFLALLQHCETERKEIVSRALPCLHMPETPGQELSPSVTNCGMELTTRVL